APGVGKATLIGNMMFKYGGIDLMTMQEFEKEGIRTYDRACEKLKGLPTPLNFDTPEYHVTLLDGQPAEADCVIFVVAPDFLPQAEKDYGIWTRLTHAKELILLVNKMCGAFPERVSSSTNQERDVFAWSQEQFGKAVQECTAFLQDRGIDATRWVTSL
ncbi:hypothetical protein MMC17_007207, partial [Xylographa soralifera]|nr:hypothetical protein [Xylographa soralifera]